MHNWLNKKFWDVIFITTECFFSIYLRVFFWKISDHSCCCATMIGCSSVYLVDDFILRFFAVPHCSFFFWPKIFHRTVPKFNKKKDQTVPKISRFPKARVYFFFIIFFRNITLYYITLVLPSVFFTTPSSFAQSGVLSILFFDEMLITTENITMYSHVLYRPPAMLQLTADGRIISNTQP